jgi:glycosyltransferase involved in cell wall biosynthesis
VPKVLHVFEPADGGVAEHVRLQVHGAGALGWEAACVGPEHGEFVDAIAAAGTQLWRLPFGPGLGRPLADLRLVGPLVRIMRASRADLVHTHSTKAGIAGRLAARVAGLPVVHTPHAWPYTGPIGRPRRALAIAVERAMHPLTADVICVSEHEQGAARHAGFAPQRVHLVPNGCPPCAPVAPAAELVALGAGGPVVTSLSSFRAFKRVDVFIDAAPRILAASPAARVAVVGTGPLESELRAQARRLGLLDDPRFAFLPFTPPVARYLHASAVLVNSSDSESLSVGLLEALACGVPQVATDVGGSREAVTRETGALVPPDDPAALAAAVVELLADAPRRATMAAASRARHRRHFGVERMVAETIDVYVGVLG